MRSGEEILKLQEMRDQGMFISDIARTLGMDRKTVRKYLDLGVEPLVRQGRVNGQLKMDMRARILLQPDDKGVCRWATTK